MRGAVRHLADGAALVDFPAAADADANQAAQDLAAALAAAPAAGLLEAVPAARTLLLLFDPDQVAHERIEQLLERTEALPLARAARTVRLPARYGGEDGPDLDELARAAGLPAGELARLHAAADHRVAFLGFAPGFAYLRGTPRELSVPRLRSPRLRVPAGSIGVADGYSGIYPAQTPGGWRLIGRVAARMFDPRALPPSLLLPGDRVVFEPVGAVEFAELARAAEEPRTPAISGQPILRVLSPGPFTAVQGGPRHGLGAFAVPAGGAMDLPLLAATNALLRNAALAAGLEMTLSGAELEVLEEARFAIGGDLDASILGRPLAGPGPHAARRGDRLKLGTLRSGVRAYLCIGGGLALPPPGERSRALRRSDEVARAKDPPPPSVPLPPLRPAGTTLELRALPGPQSDLFTAEGRREFFSAAYRVSPEGDRRGLRLLGPAVELAGSADIAPEGTAPGSVQVPGGGQPIVLGPDRPVTGGYPKIATVIGADLPLLAQARPGATIRFRAATLEEALEARRGWR